MINLRMRTKRYEMHCKEISIYVFPEKELRGLRPNFHILVSVSDLNDWFSHFSAAK